MATESDRPFLANGFRGISVKEIVKKSRNREARLEGRSFLEWRSVAAGSGGVYWLWSKDL